MAFMDPISDAGRYLDELHKEQQARLQSEQFSRESFLSACQALDANMVCTFGNMVNDYSQALGRALRAVGEPTPKRYQTLAENMVEAMDYDGGPTMTEVMQLLLNVGYGHDSVNAPQQARNLVTRMASTWAQFNSEEI